LRKMQMLGRVGVGYALILKIILKICVNP
jgi:hypothetical protein